MRDADQIGDRVIWGRITFLDLALLASCAEVQCGLLMIALGLHLGTLNARETGKPIGGALMNRERGLKITLGVVGAVFLLLAYPMVVFFRADPSLSMMFSLYVTLGVLLLLAIRSPSDHSSLIAFTAWSSFAHAVVMGLQALLNIVARIELAGVAFLLVVGVVLIALAPVKRIADRKSPALSR